jgi:hypothetical protein
LHLKADNAWPELAVFVARQQGDVFANEAITREMVKIKTNKAGDN